MNKIPSQLLLEILVKMDFVTLTRIRRISSFLNSFVENNRFLLAYRRYSKHVLSMRIHKDHVKVRIVYNNENKERVYCSISDPWIQLSALGYNVVSVVSEVTAAEDFVYEEVISTLNRLKPFTVIIKTDQVPEEHVLDILSNVRKAQHAQLYMAEGSHQSLIFHPTVKACKSIDLAVVRWHPSFPVDNVLQTFGGFDHVNICIPQTREAIHNMIWDIHNFSEIPKLKSFCVRFDNERFLDDEGLPPIKTLWTAELASPASEEDLFPLRLHLLKTRKACLLISECRIFKTGTLLILIFNTEEESVSHFPSWLIRGNGHLSDELDFGAIDRSDYLRLALPEESLWSQISNPEMIN